MTTLSTEEQIIVDSCSGLLADTYRKREFSSTTDIFITDLVDSRRAGHWRGFDKTLAKACTEIRATVDRMHRRARQQIIENVAAGADATEDVPDIWVWCYRAVEKNLLAQVFEAFVRRITTIVENAEKALKV